jgi:glucose/mannose-6-phosphate isomerase
MTNDFDKKVDVLDNLNEIKQIDKSGMLELQKKVPEFIKDAIERARNLVIPSDIEVKGKKLKYYNFTQIIGVGMGGSAISFDFLRSFLRYSNVKIPIESNRDYNLPPYADENTLVVLISYSGNTEETLSCFLDAIEIGCPIVALTSGGILEAFCIKLNLPYVKLPSGLPPRASLPYLFFPLLVILEKLNYPSFEKDVTETLAVVEVLKEELKPETLIMDNFAKRIAICLYNKIPLIYGHTYFDSVANRIKCQFNENSKVHAFSEIYPESNHNEIVGWEADDEKLIEPFYPIFIRDPDEQPAIKARIEITRDQIILRKKKQVIEIVARGEGVLAKMFSVTYIGDFASIYLAVLVGVDPTPVDSISLLKSLLAERTKLKEDIQVKFDKF